MTKSKSKAIRILKAMQTRALTDHAALEAMLADAEEDADLGEPDISGYVEELRDNRHTIQGHIESLQHTIDKLYELRDGES